MSITEEAVAHVHLAATTVVKTQVTVLNASQDILTCWVMVHAKHVIQFAKTVVLGVASLVLQDIM